MKCQRAGCEWPARWAIGFRAWAKGYPKATTPPLTVRPFLFVCDAHKHEARIDELLGEAQAQTINHRLVIEGRAPIDRRTAELLFEEL